MINSQGLTLTVFGMVVFLASCAGPGPAVDASSVDAPGPIPAAGAPLDEQLDYYLATPEYAEISDDQVQVLRNAAKTGQITFQDLKTTIENTFACLADSGMSPELDPVDNSGPYPTLFYKILYGSQLSFEESRVVADACIVTNSGLVERLYVTQPSSVALTDAYWQDTLKPLEVACLTENGVAVPEDPTYDELAKLIDGLWRDPDTHEIIGPNCYRDGTE